MLQLCAAGLDKVASGSSAAVMLLAGATLQTRPQSHLRVCPVLEQYILYVLLTDGPTFQESKAGLHEEHQKGTHQHLHGTLLAVDPKPRQLRGAAQ